MRATDGQAALDALAEAMARWRGPTLGDDPRWPTHPAAVAVNREVVDAVLTMADLAAGLRAHHRVIADLQRVAVYEPYHEGLHLRLMLALAGVGDRVGALTVYAQLRGRLNTDLGIDPSAEVQAAERHILRDDDTRPTHGWWPTAGSLFPVLPATLPGDVDDFTGRSDHVRRLVGALGGETAGALPVPVVLAIHGMAGVGKTALAVHVAHRVAARFPDGQLYLDLHGNTTSPLEPAEALAKLLYALGVDPPAVPADPTDRAGLLRSLLARRRIVLVLDNAGSPGQIRPLLPGSGPSAVLVTSRTRLSGIGGRHQLRLDVFDPTESVTLLSRQASGRVATDTAAAREIARLCGGLPLALRVVWPDWPPGPPGRCSTWPGSSPTSTPAWTGWRWATWRYARR